MKVAILPTVQDTGWYSAVPSHLYPRTAGALGGNYPVCHDLALRRRAGAFPLLSGLKGSDVYSPATVAHSSQERRLGPVWLSFSLAWTGSCETVCGGRLWLDVALDTVFLDLSRKAVEEQEGGWRKRRRKQAAGAPGCAHLLLTLIGGARKPVKHGS